MEEKKSVFTVKNVLRVLTLICIAMVFCPTCLVSCSGQTMDVSIMTAVGGLKSSYGERIVDPHPIMIICLLIPVAVFVLLFIKKFTDQKTAMMIAIGSGVDLVVWFIFRAAVKKIAEENYCSFKSTGWFVLNIISLVLIIALSVLVMLQKLQLDSDLIAEAMGGKTRKIEGFCAKCGSPIGYGYKFCTKCGTPVSQSMNDEEN